MKYFATKSCPSSLALLCQLRKPEISLVGKKINKIIPRELCAPVLYILRFLNVFCAYQSFINKTSYNKQDLLPPND